MRCNVNDLITILIILRGIMLMLLLLSNVLIICTIFCQDTALAGS